MTIKEQIDKDLKTAMLAGEKETVTSLRGLKSAILYVEVAKGNREQGLSDAEVIEVLSKESKKRQESADLFKQGGNNEKAEAEMTEKQLIAAYLPAQMDEAAVKEIVSATIAELGVSGQQAMGQVIGAVRAKTAGQADGALIARLVKESLA